MEDVKVLVSGQTSELIIRKGEAYKVYDPEKINIHGCIGTVARFLKNRISRLGELECNIQADVEQGVIQLFINETSHFFGFVQSKITTHPDIEKFGINTGEYTSPEKMANHLKMRKHLFESQSEYSAIYSALKAFRAKVNQEIDAIKDDRGNYEQKKAQVVEHNIPEGFKIKVPLFKGTDPHEILVEFLVNPSLEVALSSTDLIQLSDETRSRLIHEELKEIENVAANIVVLYI